MSSNVTTARATIPEVFTEVEATDAGDAADLCVLDDKAAVPVNVNNTL